MTSQTKFRHCHGENAQVWQAYGKFNEMPRLLREAAVLIEENESVWVHHLGFTTMEDPDYDLSLTVILS